MDLAVSYEAIKRNTTLEAFVPSSQEEEEEE